MASSSRHRTPPPSSYNPHYRPGSRHTASSYDVRLFDGPNSHRRAASSSAATPFPRSFSFNRPTTPIITQLPIASDAHFSRYLSTSLGSPFLTTTDAPWGTEPEHERLPSPVPTTDFSIIDIDLEAPDFNPFIPGSYPSSRSRIIPPTPNGRGLGGNPSLGAPPNRHYPATWDQQHSPPQNSLKSLLPRLWDALASPSRSLMNFSTSTSGNGSPSSSASSSRTTSPHTSPQAHHLSGNPPTIKGKGKLKSGGFFSTRTNHGELGEDIDYSELSPLDGEEGELVDEACFIEHRAESDGKDILSLLPPELALHVLVLLCTPSNLLAPSAGGVVMSPGGSSPITSEASNPHVAVDTLLSCRRVSKTWCRLASDNAVWRALFIGRWTVDLRRGTGSNPEVVKQMREGCLSLGKTWDPGCHHAPPNIASRAKRNFRRYASSSKLSASYTDDACRPPVASAPLQLDWRVLYRERLKLDLRWSGAAKVATPEEKEGLDYFGSLVHGRLGEEKRMARSFEPNLMRISGHTDSVYSLEFDSRRIITGSRDRTIKIWSLKTGKHLATFSGAHNGSVLCLKFDKDWDRQLDEDDDYDDEDEWTRNTAGASQHGLDLLGKGTGTGKQSRKGFMVSGSSDCSVCVWDLELGARVAGDENDEDREVKAEVRAVLKGHNGGVLDLKIDERWIVSCSKDAVIRVWNRKTLELHRTLRGHEGPVNAVGLQSGKVVSASGDGKMILWDIESGERLRTFEGHDRGLACIEFKDDLIVSGSNDCKIKVWSASTGECLRTLVGHEALVRALSFDPRNCRLVSASYDKTVKVWDLCSGKLIREFAKTHTSHIFDVKFDVSRIVSTSHDQKIVVLDFSDGLDASLFV